MRAVWFAGPISSFLVVSDPAAAKHVLRSTDNPKNPLYNKGLVAEVCTVVYMHKYFISYRNLPNVNAAKSCRAPQLVDHF